MTAGQGGPSEEPAGQPGGGGSPPGGSPGWDAPAQPSGGHPAAPQQPGYPPAPQGYPPQGYPPQGYPPQDYPPQGYPPQGYGPAPSAPASWGAQAPQPLERPVTVKAGIGAFMASLILGVIGSVVTFTDLEGLIERTLAQAQGVSTSVALTHDTVRAAIIAGGIIALVIVAVEALFIWFAWNGRNWARIVLWVIGGFGVVSGFFGLVAGTALSGFLGTLSVFQFLLVLIGVVALALKPSNDWYRYRKWARAARQHR